MIRYDAAMSDSRPRKKRRSDDPRKTSKGRKPGMHRPGGPHTQRGETAAGAAPGTSWDHVAAWYDQLVGETGCDYHQHVILPAAIELLSVTHGQRVLDLACGQGVLARRLVEHGAAEVVGVDASEKLIAAASDRAAGDRRLKFVTGDVRRLWTALPSGERGKFDAAACIMAVHDFDPIEPAFMGAAEALRPGGVMVVIMMHPCFRVPRQSSWGWDEAKATQYRRLDRYATPMTIPISVSPGRDPSQQTQYFHRPLEQYVNALGAAGMGVTACRELLSHRRSEPGARSRGENRAKGEFPLFLALKAEKE